MTAADIDAVAALFWRAFRRGGPPPPDLAPYLADLFLGGPNHDPALASQLYRGQDGAIAAALLVLPMRLRINGRDLQGRLMSSYMTDPARKSRGGAELVLTIRARSQDFAFSDSASPVSVDHWTAIGGHVLSIQSLDFRIVFRPAGWLIARHRRRLGAARRPLAWAAGAIDALATRLRPVRLPRCDLSGSAMSGDAFAAAAPGLVTRFALHPHWTEDELAWLLHMAACNTVSGPLRLRQMRDAAGQLQGCAVYYAAPGGIARVLNVLARPGQDAAVLAELLAHLQALGCVGVEGMAQPFLMEPLRRLKGIHFVPRGGFCLSTRHADVLDAVWRGDAFLGGLLGEDWSRLVTDFHD